MFFRSIIVSSLGAAVTASMGADTMITPQNDFNIPADSDIGRKLMMKARLVEQDQNDGSWLEARRVEQNQNDGSWLAGFSLKYDSCASLVQLRAEGNNKDDQGLLYTQNLVKFTACPGSSDGCSGCGSGAATYVVNMMDFIDAYTEMKLEEQEYACEMIREYCYCENANDDQVCENQCYTDAGMDVCIEYEGGDDFEIQRYLECAEMEGGNGNNNNNNNNNNNRNYNQNNNGGIDMYRSYWIGPMCSEKDGKSINMRVFYDAGCTSPAPTGVYEAFHYNSPLPYESSSIVTVGDCVSCIKVDKNANQNNNNNNNNQNQNQEVAEICAQSYEGAIKCESSLSSHLGQYYYTDTTGCEFIDNILPRLEKASRKVSSSSSGASVGGGNAAATAFAVIFALTSAILGAYAFFLYRKIHRAKVNLSQAEMGIA